MMPGNGRGRTSAAPAYDDEVSDSGPSGGNPFGDNDPFKGMPLFADLAKLFQQQGPVNWEAARQLALSIAAGDTAEPNTDPLDRIKIEQLARVADLQVANATGLSTSITGKGVTVVPVTRSMAAQLALEAYRPLFEQLASALHQDEAELAVDDLPSGADPVAWMGPLMQMIGPTMLGMTAGSMVGHLARHSFGQYDLPLPRVPGDELTIVPANLDEFGGEWSLPPDDLRLWVCLQTIATHAVLGVPHVRARLERHLTDYLTGFETDSNSLERRLGDVDLGDPNGMAGLQSVFSDPEALLGAIQSPRQLELLPQFEALVTVVVGYVDHIMDTIGHGLLSSYSMVTEAVRRRRVEADQSDRFVERLFGLELTQTQYDRGSRFVAGVVERAGAEGLGRLWSDERYLPTPAEVDAPGLWLARIDLPDLPTD